MEEHKFVILLSDQRLRGTKTLLARPFVRWIISRSAIAEAMIGIRLPCIRQANESSGRTISMSFLKFSSVSF